MPYRHQIYYFRSSDKCIPLIITYPTLFISPKNSWHSKSYDFPEFFNKLLPNKRDKNNIWHSVVANFENAEMQVQSHASS